MTLAQETTKRQNEVYSEAWKLISQSSTDAPALLLPCAMLPRQARGTRKNAFTKPTVQFILSLSIFYVLPDIIQGRDSQEKKNY